MRTSSSQNAIIVEVVGVTRQVHIREKSVEQDILLGVIDETLRHVFKEAGAKVIYDYMEKKCCLKREEIAEKPEVFSAVLERVLRSGALVIEKLILQNLCSKLGLNLNEKEGYEFSDYVKELKKSFEG